MTKADVKDAEKGTTRLVDMAASLTTITLFGKTIEDSTGLPASIDDPNKLQGLQLALISGAKVGIPGTVGATCIKLPAPMIIPVPGAGRSAGECGYSQEYRAWDVSPDTLAIAYAPKVASYKEIVGSAGKITITGIDADLRIENPRFENGHFKAHIVAYCRAYGATLLDWNQEIDLSLPDGIWVPIFTFGIGSIDIVYHAPRQICIRASLGKDFGWPIGTIGWNKEFCISV